MVPDMRPATSQHPKHTLFERAQAVTPGGVHSPVRSFAAVGGDPLFISRAQGADIWDTEGRRYTDYCMAFGPLILGHGHPRVAAAATDALADGWSYGAAEPYSLALAEMITGRLPWIEKIRFVNSGTEAVMTVLRLARAVTGRDAVLKFSGCYHGHADSMLVSAGSGVANLAEASSAGIPANVAADTFVLPLGDSAAAQTLFRRHGKQIAAIIIEPLPANNGLLPQPREFIATLRQLCDEYDTLLIFDEVISGFRLSFGGYAEQSGIEPDLATYGKIIGGGFPVGAFGGRAEYLDCIAPLGNVYQAGTLSANPLAMRAGYATLSELSDGTVYDQLESRGQWLETALAEAGVPIQRRGSMWWLNIEPTQYAPLFHRLLEHGIYLPPSAVEICFLSTAHTQDHLTQLASQLAEAKR
jgi:glutamate-1-semialdehyde 2,1-aminomutase